jgi:hypothetical protein
MGKSVSDLARMLRRDERTVRDWLSGRNKVPFWVPELLRLRAFEADVRHRQMGMGAMAPRLGIVGADIIEFPAQKQKPQPVTALRLDDFDQAPAPVISYGA